MILVKQHSSSGCLALCKDDTVVLRKLGSGNWAGSVCRRNASQLQGHELWTGHAYTNMILTLADDPQMDGTGKKAKAEADPKQLAITQFFKKQKQ